ETTRSGPPGRPSVLLARTAARSPGRPHCPLPSPPPHASFLRDSRLEPPADLVRRALRVRTPAAFERERRLRRRVRFEAAFHPCQLAAADTFDGRLANRGADHQLERRLRGLRLRRHPSEADQTNSNADADTCAYHLPSDQGWPPDYR